MSSGLVQYIVVRGYLLAALRWPVGAVIAQACHAATAVMWTHREDPQVVAYAADLDRMHKIVLEVPDEAGLRRLSAELEENGCAHKLWVEQPENEPTCLATKPHPKAEVQRLFKRLKLYKGPALAASAATENK